MKGCAVLTDTVFHCSARRSKKFLRDRVDRGTLAPQMEPEDVYSQFRGAIPAGMLLSMSAALRVTEFRWRTFSRSTTRDYKFVRGPGGSLYSRITDGDCSQSRKIMMEFLTCSSCFHQSAFQSASLNKSSTAAMFPRGPVKLVVVLTSFTAENMSLCIREYPIMKIHW